MKRYSTSLLFCLALLSIKCTPQEKELIADPDDWVGKLEKELKTPDFKKDTFDINDYGAVPADLAQNTEAFKKAIEACTENGGGVVLVSSGTWLVGPIHLQSGVNLHLAKGATLSFSRRHEDYLPMVLIQRGGFYCYNYSPPIYANNCNNVGITGEGTLDGNGQVWWPWKKSQPGMATLFKMGKAGIPVEERRFGTPEHGVRPPFVQFIKCTNIYIDGPTFVNGPSWNIHPVHCTNIIIKNITVQSHGPNNDGIDPDMCKNVLIENCVLDVGDDNIAIKSGRDEEAWRIGVPSENIIIRNCHSKRGHGGFVIGSEMSAGVRNVLVENCRFQGTKRGIRLKTRLGRGGYVENITVRDISMENIIHEAIVLNMQYDGEVIERDIKYSENEAIAKSVPFFKNITIEGVQCQKAGVAIKLLGLGDQTLSGVNISDVAIKAKTGIIIDRSHNISLNRLKLDIEEDIKVNLSNVREVKITSENLLETDMDAWLRIDSSADVEINNRKF